MKIHEYQGKELFRKAGVPVPEGFAVFSVEEALNAYKKLNVETYKHRLRNNQHQKKSHHQKYLCKKIKKQKNHQHKRYQ